MEIKLKESLMYILYTPEENSIKILTQQEMFDFANEWIDSVNEWVIDDNEEEKWHKVENMLDCLEVLSEYQNIKVIELNNHTVSMFPL